MKYLIEVNKNTFETMTAVMTRDHTCRTDVNWNGFIEAMRSIGFRVTGITGSKFRFDPPAIMQRRTIVIHDPHTPALDKDQLRWLRKKLVKNYDWSEESFVRRSDEEEGGIKIV
ncbi:hypothetical protein BKA93DRAFT_747041 [Sparassis latifolia]|uniref:Uncharacterized protein n=1 Tax=Sparassis crispa TaxID=139825 RepID=A0A401H731_9APHY|nr:hypothetical protein SCP_1900950 [Sparassis crispa]GBE90246.1 hypothetical protein SCP_1900950 [Sparassis crispa]